MNYKKIQLNFSNNIIIPTIIISLFIIYYSPLVSAASLSIDPEISPDAIAIRVMPNADHFSPLLWYKKNIKLHGSPQDFLVDGYEAVRDGRTVYVNAANISGNNFFTNIYIISYNQEAETPTIDIFGQILSHWKFNINPEISNIQKQKIIRDVKRLANLYDLNSALANYKEDAFPRLKSGSYIIGASVSTWPSWQATLGKELAATMPIDPINKLAGCLAGYDAKTCWNQADKAFYFNFNLTAADAKSISHSPVYWYKDGVFYASMETGYNIISSVDHISFNVAAP